MKAMIQVARMYTRINSMRKMPEVWVFTMDSFVSGVLHGIGRQGLLMINSAAPQTRNMEYMP